jgi:hypothetical protein
MLSQGVSMLWSSFIGKKKVKQIPSSSSVQRFVFTDVPFVERGEVADEVHPADGDCQQEADPTARYSPHR